MAGYVLSGQARADLQAIADFTEKTWGAAQAASYLAQLEARVELLSANPKMGRARTELKGQIRSFLVASHVVYYVERESQIAVVRILHKRQDPVRHL